MIFYIAVRVLDFYGTFVIMYLTRQLTSRCTLPVPANQFNKLQRIAVQSLPETGTAISYFSNSELLRSVDQW